MKKIIFILLCVLMVLPAEAQEEKITRVKKMIDLPGLFSRDGVLQDSIAIETLSSVPAVILAAGSIYPAQASMKFGISADCGCAKFRIYRVPQDGRTPSEVSYDAIRGFSADNQTVTVLFEVAENRKIRLSVEVPETLPPGQLLEWLPAQEIQGRLPAEEKKEEAVEKPVEETAIAAVPAPESAPVEAVEPVPVDPARFVDDAAAVDEVVDEVAPEEALPEPAPSAEVSTPPAAPAETVSEEKKVHGESGLGGNWVLEKAASEKLAAARVELEVDSEKESFAGQAPCNRYSGVLQMMENSVISFENPVATRRACPELEAESEYFQILAKVDSYRREDGTLVLITGDLDVLRFKKAD